MNKKNSPNVTFRHFVMYVCPTEIGSKPDIHVHSLIYWQKPNSLLPFFLSYIHVSALDITAEIWTSFLPSSSSSSCHKMSLYLIWRQYNFNLRRHIICITSFVVVLCYISEYVCKYYDCFYDWARGFDNVVYVIIAWRSEFLSPSLGYRSSNIFKVCAVLWKPFLKRTMHQPSQNCCPVYTDPCLTHTKVKLHESKKIEKKKNISALQV